MVRRKHVKATELMGPLEASVMSEVWRRPGVTAGEVTDHINETRRPPISYKTILTVFARVERKGWVTHVQDGRAYRYTSVLSEQEFAEAHARKAVTNYLDRYGDLAMAGFVAEIFADDSRVEELEELLAEQKRGQPV